MRTRQVEPTELDEDQFAPEPLSAEGARFEPSETDRVWLAADRGVTGAGFQWDQCDAEQDYLSGSDPLEECLWDVLDRAPLTLAG